MCKCKNLKEHRVCEKDLIRDLATCSFKKGYYLVFSYYWRFSDYLWLNYRRNKKVLENFNEKRWPVKRKLSIFYLSFY